MATKMTADTKAPSSNEVDGLPADQDAANRLISIAMRELKRKKDKGDIAARITLDHIAALTAELEIYRRNDPSGCYAKRGKEED